MFLSYNFKVLSRSRLKYVCSSLLSKKISSNHLSKPLLNKFKISVNTNIETSQLICTTNQVTRFLYEWIIVLKHAIAKFLISCRNQSFDFQCKSNDWFPYEIATLGWNGLKYLKTRGFTFSNYYCIHSMHNEDWPPYDFKFLTGSKYSL